MLCGWLILKHTEERAKPCGKKAGRQEAKEDPQEFGMGEAEVGRKKRTDCIWVLDHKASLNEICYGLKVYLMGPRPVVKLFYNS